MTNRPSVFIGRRCTLVSDQWSILFGRASRRHRLPRLSAITLSHSRTSLDRNRWQLSRVIFTACLPSLVHATEDEDYNVKANAVQFRRQPSQRVRKLAAQVAANPNLFSAHLPQLVRVDGHCLYEFGAKLADGRCSQETVDAVISAQLSALPEMKTQFISGYFAGLKARAQDLWEASVCGLLHGKRSREIGVALVCGAGVSERISCALLTLFKDTRRPKLSAGWPGKQSVTTYHTGWWKRYSPPW